MAEKEIENPDWDQRVNRLLSTSVTHQVGSALEILQKEVVAIGERLAALQASQDAGPGPDPSLGETLARVGELQQAIATVDSAVRSTSERLEAVDSAVRGSSERLGAMDGVVRGTVEALASLGERLGDLATRPAPESVDPTPALEELRASFEAKLEVLGRQVGAPLGRLRIQLEELAAKAGTDPELAARVADLGSRVDDLSSNVEQRANQIDARTVAFARELADAVGAVARDVDARLTVLAQDTTVTDAVTAVASDVARLEEQAAERDRVQAERLSALLAEQQEASERRTETAAQQHDALRSMIEQTLQGRTVAMENAVRSAVEDAVRARIGELETAIGGVVAERIERARAATETTIAAAIDRMLAALEPSIARRIEGVREALEQQIASATDGLVQTSRDTVAPVLEAIAGSDAAIAARAEESERRANDLGERVDAVAASLAKQTKAAQAKTESAVGALSSRLEALQTDFDALANRPDTTEAVREELTTAIIAATEPVAAMRDGMKGMVDLFSAMGERLASLERSSTEASRAVKGQTENVTSAVSDTVRAQVEEMTKQIAALDRRLLGLASAQQVADALQRDRDVMEKGFADHGEQLQTLSGSAGAIYVRVRALEHAFDEMRKESEEDRVRFNVLLESLKEIMALEQRLSVRFASMENRMGETDTLRDREFAALLAELANMVSKGDRGRFAEKLRIFERRLDEPVGSEPTQ